MKNRILDGLALFLIAIAMFVCVLCTRPLIPIDETRYMSIAWEMWLRHKWFDPLTMNFEPYDHKPPALFWIINLSWSIFGVSRWAALLSVILISFGNLFLAAKIYKKIFPLESAKSVPWILLGSFPFMMYSTLVMFDMAVCLLVQISLLCLLNFACEGKWRWMIGMGFAMGIGLLTKGPVVYLYLIFPVLFGPLWNGRGVRPGKWYGGFAIALAISISIVLLWLVPVLRASNDDFAATLVWHQTVDRILGVAPKAGGKTANTMQVHERPFYFYFLLLPVIFIPWGFFPSLWKKMAQMRFERPFILLSAWFLPTFLAFSLMSGKQAHYLIPIVPAAIMAIAYLLRDVSESAIVKTAFVMTSLFIFSHIAGSALIFTRYDLNGVATLLKPYEKRNIAYATNYHAELGFEGRLTKKIEDVPREKIMDWFTAHPQGIAVVRYENDGQVKYLHKIEDFPYRFQRMGIFERKREP